MTTLDLRFIVVNQPLPFVIHEETQLFTEASYSHFHQPVELQATLAKGHSVSVGYGPSFCWR